MNSFRQQTGLQIRSERFEVYKVGLPIEEMLRILGMNRILIRSPRRSNISWGNSWHGHIIRSESFLLLFSSFVVLEPIEDI